MNLVILYRTKTPRPLALSHDKCFRLSPIFTLLLITLNAKNAGGLGVRPDTQVQLKNVNVRKVLITNYQCHFSLFRLLSMILIKKKMGGFGVRPDTQVQLKNVIVVSYK